MTEVGLNECALFMKATAGDLPEVISNAAPRVVLSCMWTLLSYIPSYPLWCSSIYFFFNLHLGPHLLSTFMMCILSFIFV